MEGLAEGGYKEGEGVTVKFQNGQGDTSTVAMIAKGMNDGTDLVATCGTPALQAAVRSVKGKPIVFCGVVDPVAAGGAVSSEKGKPNVTGVSNPFPVADGVALVHRFAPNAKRIGTLYDPSEPFFPKMDEAAKAECTKDGLEWITVPISQSSDIPSGMDALKAKGVDVLLQLPGNTVNQGLDGQMKSARKLHLPVFSLQPDQLAKGVVAAVGVDLHRAGVEAGKVAARILKGEKPDAIPIGAPTQTPPVANPTAAAEYGLKVPEGMKTAP